MKKRILLVNEASYLSSGYAIYGRNLLQELVKNPNYEIAEFAIYASPNNPKISSVPWRVYPNEPANEQERQIYSQNPSNIFGAWKFEHVCLDFKPTHVLDIRDYWMISYQANSPFRPYFNWLIMPTVDAEQQREEWLDVYLGADGVLTYQDWSAEVLKNETGNRINWLGAAPPAASSEFQPYMDREKIKQGLGFRSDDIILGTVMRNQRRKLYPDLFKAFRRFLDESGRENVFLYCHTSYPDNGWDIPSLLKKYGLGHKVYFTYVCQAESDGQEVGCGAIFASTFQDAISVCPKCKQRTAGLSAVRRGIPNDALAKIYNIFDLYIQYANSEGFGMPQSEAAACGVPIMATDYSAMSDIVRKLGGYPVKEGFRYTEMETGCIRVHPSEDDFVEKVTEFVNLPNSMKLLKRQETKKNFEENYNSWAKTANVWSEAIDSLPVKESWESPPKIMPAMELTEKTNQLDNAQFSEWLITHVLREPERLNSYLYTRLLRDLNYGVSQKGIASLYSNEDSSLVFGRPDYEKFSREDAYKEILKLAHHRNKWENTRYQSLQN